VAGPPDRRLRPLLARAGLRVLLLERDAFPRYHIGESLLASFQSTLKLSGAYDAVAARGLQIKRGVQTTCLAGPSQGKDIFTTRNGAIFIHDGAPVDAFTDFSLSSEAIPAARSHSQS
jgi:flavin-dependent dehydrogenase